MRLRNPWLIYYKHMIEVSYINNDNPINRCFILWDDFEFYKNIELYSLHWYLILLILTIQQLKDDHFLMLNEEKLYVNNDNHINRCFISWFDIECNKKNESHLVNWHLLFLILTIQQLADDPFLMLNEEVFDIKNDNTIDQCFI